MIARIKKLLEENTAYSIGKATGVHPNLLQQYKTGVKKVENMTLVTAEKLIKYLEEKEK